MEVMRVHDFRAACHPKLGWIAEIGSRNGRGRVAEGIGSVRHRLVAVKAHVGLKLDACAMRFTPVIQQPRARPIGIGMRIALGQHFALLIQEAKRFIAGLMIENREFSKVRSFGSSIMASQPLAIGLPSKGLR